MDKNFVVRNISSEVYKNKDFKDANDLLKKYKDQKVKNILFLDKM